jgi:hypothetical protein
VCVCVCVCRYVQIGVERRDIMFCRVMVGVGAWCFSLRWINLGGSWLEELCSFLFFAYYGIVNFRVMFQMVVISQLDK